jgi:hypothetical protein
LELDGIRTHIFNLSGRSFKDHPPRAIVGSNEADTYIWILPNVVQLQRFGFDIDNYLLGFFLIVKPDRCNMWYVPVRGCQISNYRLLLDESLYTPRHFHLHDCTVLRPFAIVAHVASF